MDSVCNCGMCHQSLELAPFIDGKNSVPAWHQICLRFRAGYSGGFFNLVSEGYEGDLTGLAVLARTTVSSAAESRVGSVQPDVDARLIAYTISTSPSCLDPDLPNQATPH